MSGKQRGSAQRTHSSVMEARVDHASGKVPETIPLLLTSLQMHCQRGAGASLASAAALSQSLTHMRLFGCLTLSSTWCARQAPDRHSHGGEAGQLTPPGWQLSRSGAVWDFAAQVAWRHGVRARWHAG